MARKPKKLNLKELPPGTPIKALQGEEEKAGVIVDNLSAQYFIEFDDGTVGFAFKGNGQVRLI